jgi:hypothetical protein
MKREQEMRICVSKDANTDLMTAVSDDMQGPVVHGRSLDEIRRRLPAKIRDALEADGLAVQSVKLGPVVGSGASEAIGAWVFTAKVELRTASVETAGA